MSRSLQQLGPALYRAQRLLLGAAERSALHTHDGRQLHLQGTGRQWQPCQQHAYGSQPDMHATTVLCVRKGDQVVMIADGQITNGNKVIKANARKLRRLEGGALGGFAGSTADGLTLFERLESKLEEHPDQLKRAAVELAKAWRQDKVLRHLQATMIVADANGCLEVSGSGEVLEPHDGVHAIGSGGRFAVAAARALMDVAGLDALAIAQRSMEIAADRCIYTNKHFVWETIQRSAGT